MPNKDNLTPAMRQYMEVKEQHPDCIVMFRMGDFYEMFFQDAKIASKELGITLTARGKGEKQAPLAGMPYHSCQSYIAKLIKKGYKVCIVEQVEDPKKAKGIVKRDVVRIITPGTVIDENMLPDKANNYIVALNKEKENISIAFADISTGEFNVLSTNPEKIHTELNKYSPSEILIPLSLENSEFTKSLNHFFLNFYDDLHFFNEKSLQVLKQHFENLPKLQDLEYSSAGALISYLKETQFSNLPHIKKINIINTEDFMVLDKPTLSNLNIISNNSDDNATLINVLDYTKTSMGSRMLKNWIIKPLLNKDKIEERLKAVEELKNNLILKDEFSEILSNINDIQRIMSRVNFKTASPKDIVALRNTLHKFPSYNKLTQLTKTKLLNKKLNEFEKLTNKLQQAIKDEPSTSTREGNIIKTNYNKELDELLDLKLNSKRWLVEFEEKEKKNTGIKFLKVKYNKVFGYFIEVSNSQINLVPDYYTRKQTQTNCERYITSELKEKENIILTADEKVAELEYKLFMEILDEITIYTNDLQESAEQLAILDVLQSFASCAILNHYTKPIITDTKDLKITSERHPIVEKREENFVSNNIELNDKTKMMIITGPNMAGKSVYIKQNALIVLMAQIGSFVPAESASIGIIDRIFSRVGASDDIASGHSTFMVEMNETANILSNATDKSFIILDEIGRGTSTYDGVSLAWSIAEYIVTRIKAKTLFATHYHQMNKMEKQYSTIKNFNIAVAEKEDNIVFLRKIVEGGTDRSYGIHVGKLAGLPTEVIENAKKIINQFEMDDEIGESLHKNLKVSKDVIEDNSKDYIKNDNNKVEKKNNCQFKLNDF
jgi:DNA mismatch repair protein MutS